MVTSPTATAPPPPPLPLPLPLPAPTAAGGDPVAVRSPLLPSRSSTLTPTSPTRSTASTAAPATLLSGGAGSGSGISSTRVDGGGGAEKREGGEGHTAAGAAAVKQAEVKTSLGVPASVRWEEGAQGIRAAPNAADTALTTPDPCEAGLISGATQCYMAEVVEELDRTLQLYHSSASSNSNNNDESKEQQQQQDHDHHHAGGDKPVKDKEGKTEKENLLPVATAQQQRKEKEKHQTAGPKAPHPPLPPPAPAPSHTRTSGSATTGAGGVGRAISSPSPSSSSSFSFTSVSSATAAVASSLREAEEKKEAKKNHQDEGAGGVPRRSNLTKEEIGKLIGGGSLVGRSGDPPHRGAMPSNNTTVKTGHASGGKAPASSSFSSSFSSFTSTPAAASAAAKNTKSQKEHPVVAAGEGAPRCSHNATATRGTGTPTSNVTPLGTGRESDRAHAPPPRDASATPPLTASSSQPRVSLAPPSLGGSMSSVAFNGLHLSFNRRYHGTLTSTTSRNLSFSWTTTIRAAAPPPPLHAAAASGAGERGGTPHSGGALRDDASHLVAGVIEEAEEADDLHLMGECVCGQLVFRGLLSLVFGSFVCSCAVCRRYNYNFQRRGVLPGGTASSLGAAALAGEGEEDEDEERSASSSGVIGGEQDWGLEWLHLPTLAAVTDALLLTHPPSPTTSPCEGGAPPAGEEDRSSNNDNRACRRDGGGVPDGWGAGGGGVGCFTPWNAMEGRRGGTTVYFCTACGMLFGAVHEMVEGVIINRRLLNRQSACLLDYYAVPGGAQTAEDGQSGGVSE